MDYNTYKNEVSSDIASQIELLRCQPVLFFGSGISRRYFGAPNWSELLRLLASNCPLIDKDYAYYAQSCSSELHIGSIFAEKYQEWAWSTGKNQFPESLFASEVSPDAFIKHAVASELKAISPNDLESINPQYHGELSALQQIKPHAVLTTNYDTLLETIFADHKVIIGQSALKGMPFTVGEIFKFHGCVNDIEQMVLTSEDYNSFYKKKKFIAARLLSLFNEHPMLIVGYGANDPNIQAILSDIDEALALPGSLIENIYFVDYDEAAEEKTSLPREKLIQIEENRSVRVKLIVASDLEWVFRAFKSPENLHAIPPNLMRAILARSYELVRSDFPRSQLSVDFDFLERKLDDAEEFAKLFGITTVSDASMTSAKFPYSLKELGIKLGGKHWHTADKLIKIIERDTGQNIKSNDNQFHHQLKINKTKFHKYSEEAFLLLLKVQKAGACSADWLD